MKGLRLLRATRSSLKIIFGIIFALNLAAGVCAQELVQTPEAPAPTPAPDAEAAQRRIARARALAATGRRGVAAGELEALRASSKDESVRDVSRILLMRIYMEMPDYARAGGLLDEIFKARPGGGESAARAYYSLAGQAVNSARAHVERYRTFGLRPDDTELPAEARTDLDQMRSMLERVLEQAKQIREEEAKASRGGRGVDATALAEDAANVRLRLARDDAERMHWQNEVADARQRLFAPETHIAQISSNLPAAHPPAGANQTPGASAPAAPPAQAANAEAQTGLGTAARSPQNTDAAKGAQTPASDAQGGGEVAAKSEGDAVSVGALHGMATQKISPSYPPIAKTARISGLVTVYVVVNERGEVERVQRADGPLQLQPAASEAARRWKFRPTLVDGQPVRVSGYINFNFLL